MEEYVVTWKRMIELKSGDTKFFLQKKKKKNDTKVRNTRNKEKSLVVEILMKQSIGKFPNSKIMCYNENTKLISTFKYV